MLHLNNWKTIVLKPFFFKKPFLPNASFPYPLKTSVGRKGVEDMS